MIDETWELRRGGEILGEVRVNDADFPWLSGEFVAHAGFAEVEPLFAAELALMKEDEEPDWNEWEAAYDRISEQMQLIDPDGKQVADFILHIEGQDAWFRWIDAAVDEE
ncbi:hypothetical protein ACFFHJ_26985 [Planotetraspora thailandica]|nr:hypothetical protein [Planotetraspora thailandica]